MLTISTVNLEENREHKKQNNFILHKNIETHARRHPQGSVFGPTMYSIRLQELLSAEQKTLFQPVSAAPYQSYSF